MKILLFEYANSISDYGNQLVDCLQTDGYEVTFSNSLLESINELYKENYNLVFVVAKNNIPNKKELTDFLEIVNNDINLTTIIISNLANIGCLDAHLYFGYDTDCEIILKNLKQVLLHVDSNSKMEFKMRDGMVIDLSNHLVKTTENGECQLSRTESRILGALLKNKNKALSRAEILKKSGLDNETRMNARVVDVHIKNIRDKLCSNNITSVRGVGYRWVD